MSDVSRILESIERGDSHALHGAPEL